MGTSSKCQSVVCCCGTELRRRSLRSTIVISCELCSCHKQADAVLRLILDAQLGEHKFRNSTRGGINRDGILQVLANCYSKGTGRWNFGGYPTLTNQQLFETRNHVGQLPITARLNFIVAKALEDHQGLEVRVFSAKKAAVASAPLVK